MIVDELLQIIGTRSEAGERLNELVDQFRRGRSPEELLVALRSENSELISIAAWICSELPESMYNTTEIISKLHELSAHRESSVRFSAFSALFPLLSSTDPSTHVLLTRLSTDSSPGVRKIAAMAAARLGRT